MIKLLLQQNPDRYLLLRELPYLNPTERLPLTTAQVRHIHDVLGFTPDTGYVFVDVRGAKYKMIRQELGLRNSYAIERL